MCVCVRVCARACVCACVCVYSSTEAMSSKNCQAMVPS